MIEDDKNAFKIILGSILCVVYLGLSTYVWLCFGVSLKYDFEGFPFNHMDYSLLGYMLDILGVILIVNLVCLLLLFGKRTHRLAWIVSHSSLFLYDIFVLISSLIINSNVSNNGDKSFLSPFVSYEVPLLLILNLFVLISITLLTFLLKERNLKRLS